MSPPKGEGNHRCHYETHQEQKYRSIHRIPGKPCSLFSFSICTHSLLFLPSDEKKMRARLCLLDGNTYLCSLQLKDQQPKSTLLLLRSKPQLWALMKGKIFHLPDGMCECCYCLGPTQPDEMITVPCIGIFLSPPIPLHFCNNKTSGNSGKDKPTNIVLTSSG